MSSPYDLFETTRELTDKFFAEERAKRVAEAIIAIGQGKVKPAPVERLSEHQAEERHRMVQAQRLK